MKNNDVTKNIVSSIIQQIIGVVCGFIVPRLILSAFGSNVNGVVTSITQFLGYITLLEVGISPVVKAALYKPIVKCDKEKIEKLLKTAENFFRTIAVIFIVYLIILCIAFPKFYKAEYEKSFTLSLLLIISISTFFEYFFGMTYNIYLQAMQKNYVVSIIKTISKVLNTVAVVVLVLNNFSIQVVKLASSLVFLITPIFLTVYVKKKYNINLSKVKAGNVLENKWAGFSQHIAAIIHNSVDVAILTFFTSPLEVSVYSVHMLVINSIKDLCTSLSSGIDAWFGKTMAQEDYEKLNKNLKLYELFYFSAITFLFACTLALQLPFVKVYTSGITDVDYIRPAFAYLMIFAQLCSAIRTPYLSIVLAAGHFKQTEKYAWTETILNLAISILLVFKFGIVGVAIGTLIATLVRTIEIVIYLSKNILKRSSIESLKKVLAIILEIILVMLVSRVIGFELNNTYINFFVYAVIVALIAVFVIFVINLLVYRNEVKLVWNKFAKKEKIKDENQKNKKSVTRS